MKTPRVLLCACLIPSVAMFLLVACGPSETPTPQATATVVEATPTVLQATATVAEATPTVLQATHEPAPFPLSLPGPYHVSRRTFAVTDPSRENRQVPITVWYPALESANSTGNGPTRNAAPDPSGAPYVLLLSSTKMADIFAPYLVSHGFAWASVDGLEPYPEMKEQMFDQPLDILFALNQVASNPPEELAGIIDAEHAGAIGYSFDGYNTLAMSGARIDPQYYLAQCPNPDATTRAIRDRGSTFSCAPATDWDGFMAQAGEALTASEDGLWQPMTDPRILAVMPMASEGWWLFGARGLAAVDRPTLVLVATNDSLCSENTLIFEHVGTSEKTLISFVGPTHMMVLDPKMVDRMAHFAVAFFGYHLQGNEDFEYYFSEDWVAHYEDLAWGAYLGK